MRAIWKGSIAFGLVNVPVKLYSATEDHDVSLHQVHNKDGGRIRYQRKCEVCSEVVAYEDIDKAYEEEGRTVVLTSAELKSLPEENSREIEVVDAPRVGRRPGRVALSRLVREDRDQPPVPRVEIQVAL